MPATWPAGVPSRILRSSGNIAEGETAIRSPTDSGLARQRAAFTAAPDVWSGNIRMTWAQYVTFAAFRKGLGGATFTWPADTLHGAVTARFLAGGGSTPMPDPETAKWLVPVRIEVLP